MTALRSIPAQLTNSEDVFGFVQQALRAGPIKDPRKVSSVGRAALVLAAEARAANQNPEDREDYALLREIAARKEAQEPEMRARRALYDRFDNLYHAQSVTRGGADHWAEDPALEQAGRVHVSVNVGAAYVGIPASLQAITPIFNYVPTDATPHERTKAEHAERLFFRWWAENEMDVASEFACLAKSLYGETAAKVWWDADEKIPRVTVIEQPGNLYLGYGNSDFSRIDWALYCYQVSPEAAAEEWDLQVESRDVTVSGDAAVYSWVRGTHDDPLATIGTLATAMRRRTDGWLRGMVEVYDYWYKKKVGKKVQVWNAIFVGNHLVENVQHPEYDGDLPYLPLTNGRVPGTPYGKSELYDIEQLLREKDERISAAAQMIQSVIGGQMWQLVGPDAPEDVPAGAIPKVNRVATPGAGNELRVIQPFVPQFAVEDYLKRLDRELTVESGLDDMLLGLAPLGALGSSKAINAIVAQYESRIALKRKIQYRWLRKLWALAAKVWENKDRAVKVIIDGNYRIDVKAPELTPRDEMEVAQMAINLVQNRLWSAERAMDRTGVEDPGDEKGIIREEQTDGAMNPAAVLTQLQLLQGYKAMGVGAPQASTDLAGAQAQSLNASRTANPPPKGSTSANGPENAANPAATSLPSNTPGGAAVVPPGGAGLISQTMVKPTGELTGRLMSQTKIGG